MITQADVIELIKGVERADSADKLLDAVKRLSEVCHQASIPTLIEVLGFNNPGAAVAAVDGLIAIGESAVPHILENLDGYNYGARAWATRALAGIGDPRGLDLLLEAAVTDFSLSVRRAATKGLGNIDWSKLPPEQVPPNQTKVLDTLLVVTQDPEWVVRYAAVVGLNNLALQVRESSPSLFTKILEHFEKLMPEESEIAVKARIKMALLEQ